jgi:hypothetical protein
MKTNGCLFIPWPPAMFESLFWFFRLGDEGVESMGALMSLF